MNQNYQMACLMKKLFKNFVVRNTGTYYCRPDLKERLHLFGLMIELNGWLLSLITF